MKILSKILGAILILLSLVLLVLRATGLEPQDRRPGLWLKGDLVTTPVADWSFANRIPTIKVQTRTWYLLPHSVTTGCVVYHGQLYLNSLVVPRAPRYPLGRQWNQNVARDPHVRLKIGNQLFDRTVSHVTDPSEIAAVTQRENEKYPSYNGPEGSIFNVFRVSN